MTISHDNLEQWKNNVSSTGNFGSTIISDSESFDEFMKFKEELLKSNQFTGKRVFESGSQRDDDSYKPLTTALTAYARLRYGYHLRKGSNNYGKDNWKLGQPSEALLESIDRHLAQYLSGDRSEDHLSAIMFGIVMLMQNEEKIGIKPDYYFNIK